MGVAERQLWVFAFHAAAGRGDKGRSKQAVQKVIVRFSSSSTPFGLWDHRIAQPIQCCEDYSLSVGRPKNGDVLSSICCAAGQRTADTKDQNVLVLSLASRGSMTWVTISRGRAGRFR